MRRRIATTLCGSALLVGGIVTPALADHHAGSCPNARSGWVQIHAAASPHNANDDGHICEKMVKGNGNHGDGISHKDNNSPLSSAQ